MAPSLVLGALLLLLGSLTSASPNASLRARALTPAGPGTLPAGWTYTGCYLDNGNPRTLNSASYTSGNAMTDESCVAFCNGKGYVYAGVEYAQECYCGNAFTTKTSEPGTDCSMACSGNANEPCGGPNRLNIFWSGATPPLPPSTNPGPPGWQLVSCYSEGTSGRALTTGMAVTGGMTVAKCTSACGGAGYILAGVEYAQECYCGNAISNGGAIAAIGDCNMLCTGNSSEFCGAGNRLDVYKSTGGGGNPTTSPGGPSSTVSIGGGATGLPSGWKYDGCYVDNLNGRILTHQQPDNQQLTAESCVNACAGLGYTVAGMEYAVQCFCDNSIGSGGALAANQADCSTPCPGNANEKCGNGNRLNVYNIGTLVVTGPPSTGNVPGWTYRGCRTDNVGNPQVRTLVWQIILTNNNSAENCLGLCSKFGYNAGGMEYGSECYCGDISYVQAGGSNLAPQTDCTTFCSGSSTELCGGGNRLSYYEWTGAPLYTWHTPQGNAAGQYQFLIGGVVVPLITTSGVNGKVTFVEKYGTSENASSTGAYELDLALLNDFSKAWRPMHVKTDVFCSASLTLPDKVGRQINIGGWAEQSVYGIRLYWPDGSPGVWGVNDWQENYNEVRLQTARWYPTAMVMTNGSILVLGGEVGSNSAPSPTLELLPPTGGGLVFLDWLQRTDPLNLYPFLCVLPSGGIFVAYYNEARILDAGSFATIKTLPNMPGSVNNFLAGRTYPLEGTMMIMPQHAPYSDPLSVLVCGGSSTGAGEAIDNCVSTQPEVANPVWTIERMPSKRVMTCMCALPDGTYLIANGAHQGVAGFGLATDPNLQAVLYDPSQPVGSRMSIMASTIVARLYHSEATLLQDGRVIISGSDPQDGVHPEEYRVEVFVPPYLLSGAPQPSFSITNSHWNYNDKIIATVNLPSGNAGNARFSLMGAASSTHGNSMGQRTIFPTVNCGSATSCTITAPPNVNICPMGWFMLFLLDGPTPSHATWVRIGGDPGNLGNWPNFPDFKIPGV